MPRKRKSNTFAWIIAILMFALFLILSVSLSNVVLELATNLLIMMGINSALMQNIILIFVAFVALLALGFSVRSIANSAGVRK